MWRTFRCSACQAELEFNHVTQMLCVALAVPVGLLVAIWLGVEHKYHAIFAFAIYPLLWPLLSRWHFNPPPPPSILKTGDVKGENLTKPPP